MKTFFIILACSITFIASAQNDREVSIDDFHTIKAFDLINVQLVKSNENKLVIKGADANDVTYVFKDGLLKLRMETDKIFDGDNTYVVVNYTNLKTIDANEGAQIYAKDISGLDAIEIRTQEGASVTAGIDVNKVEVRAVTGGIVKLSGKAIKQNVTVYTGGVVENSALITESSDVKVQAGGEVEVHATRAVDVIVRAGGNVMVTGNPKSVNQKTTLGGDITIN